MLLEVVNIGERIGVEDNQIGEFADFDGPQILVAAEFLGAVDGRGVKGFHRGEPAHLQHPQFPVSMNAGGESVVAADGYQPSGVRDAGGILSSPVPEPLVI
jgi:hypothetical protein